MSVSLSRARKRLVATWFIGSGALLLLGVLLTMLGKYGDKAGDAWSWLLPTFMPTLSLMIGVLVTSKPESSEDDQSADRFLSLLAWIMSISYLVVVSLSMLLAPIATSFGPLELMKVSNLWLVPLQGLVSAAIGAFFIKKVAANEYSRS